MTLRAQIASILLFAAGAFARCQSHPGPVPPVHASTLSGTAVDLPEALQGKTGVLVLGFSQTARGQATDWGKRLGADYRDSRTVTYYEMPVLEAVPRMLRGWVVKKIAADVPDRAKPHFLPILDHEREWKTLAAYGKSDDAYVLVVDEHGFVRLHLQGAVSDATYAQVKRMVDELAPK